MFFVQNALNFMHMSEMQEEMKKKFFCFWDNGVWNFCGIFCIILREYLSAAVKLLTNSLRISYQTEDDFFQLNLPRIDEKRG